MQWRLQHCCGPALVTATASVQGAWTFWIGFLQRCRIGTTQRAQNWGIDRWIESIGGPDRTPKNEHCLPIEEAKKERKKNERIIAPRSYQKNRASAEGTKLLISYRMNSGDEGLTDTDRIQTLAVSPLPSSHLLEGANHRLERWLGRGNRGLTKVALFTPAKWHMTGCWHNQFPQCWVKFLGFCWVGAGNAADVVKMDW